MTGKKGKWTKSAKLAQKEKRRLLEHGEEVDENYITQLAQPLPLENKLFEEYYVNQGILSQDEVEKFMEYTQKPLPLSFRLSLDKSNVRELLRVLKRDFFPKLTELGPDGGVLQPPTNIPWLLDETTWQMQLDETAAAENKVLQDFRKILYQETQCGNIIQQDVASMLPGYLLDVKPHHKVLDLRASPGHRAMHLVQMLHSDEKVPNPDGVVIANETHLKRCFSLCDHIKHFFSPNFATVNMDANNLPSLFLSEDKDPEPLVYDRIVCGFPSSGDGLFRNNLDGLRCWTANVPLSHHGHLTQMLYSGLSSLEIGGRLVFFTYSMNPVEAEAVAFAVIMQQRGTVELVDISKEMPDLIYEKGLHSWRVVAKGPRWFREYDEVPEHLQTLIWPSMFPPSKEEAERVGLEKCVRILPHKQNTVGLFIAVFTRTSSLFEAYQREQEEQQKAYEAAEEARRLEEAKLLEEKEKKKLEEEAMKNKAEEKTEESEKKDEEDMETVEGKGREEEKDEKKMETVEGKGREEEKDEKKMETFEGKGREEEKDEKKMETFEGKGTEEEKDEKKMATVEGKGTEEEKDKKKMKTVEGKGTEEEKNSKKTEEGEEKKVEVDVVEETKGEEKSEAVVAEDERREDVTEADRTKEGENMGTEKDVGKGGKKQNGFEDQHGDGGNGADSTSAECGGETGNYYYYSTTYQEEDGGAKGGDADDTRRSRIEGQFDFLDANDKLWLQIKDFYGFSDDFPFMRVACRPVSGLKQNFFLVTDTIKKLVQTNQSIYSFVHVGVKIFTYMKQSGVACCYRLALEGLSTILPYMTKRIITVSKRDFIAILSSHSPTMEALTVKTKKEVTNLDKGGFAFLLEPDRAKNSCKCQLIVSAWKNEDSAYRTFIPAYQRLHYLRLVGANMNDYEEHPETHQDVECAMAAFAKNFPL